MPIRIRGDWRTIAGTLSMTGAKISNSARRQMQNEAYNLRNIARWMVPLERGDMTRAIIVEKRSEKRYWVGVDEGSSADGRPGYVGAYLTFLHEDPSYQLGPLSLAKAATSRYKVDRKFMERAYDEAVASGMLKRVRDAVKREMNF